MVNVEVSIPHQLRAKGVEIETGRSALGIHRVSY